MSVYVLSAGTDKDWEHMSSCVKLRSRQRNRFPGNISIWLGAHITVTERFQREPSSADNPLLEGVGYTS